MDRTQSAESVGALVAKGGPPTLGTIAVFGFDLSYLLTLGIGTLTLIWWCWVLWDKWHNRRSRKRGYRRRRGD